MRTIRNEITLIRELEGVDIIKPIPITIQRDEDGSFVAGFESAGIFSGGETMTTATASIEGMIAASFRILDSIPTKHLGPKMAREKRVLSEYIRR